MRTPLKVLGVPVTVVALLALSACGTETTPGSQAGGDRKGNEQGTVQTDLALTGVKWTVESATVGGRKATAPKNTFVQIDDKGAVKGNYGCNSFTGRASVKGDAVDLDKLMSTQMACDVQDFELSMRKAFKEQLKAKVEGDRLTLTTAKGDTVALTSNPKAEAAAPLAGTKWTVTSFADRKTVGGGDSTAATLPQDLAGKAYLTFGKDGSVRGRTGCNSLNGKAEAKDGTLAFGRIATTRMMCQGAAGEVEKKLLKVLTGEATYTVDGRSLSLTGPAGVGLEATATP
ncbi:META domain-containing protein [Streptomyces sp. NBC_00237]|uniref:META domain-containing protein n=1 Tax=Streptomyces sp. NBC_00237 TaxID=2975687 RepID=UPI0022554251|nr:META domain-containing protein [Streptomyces sp. NBC_00237]